MLWFESGRFSNATLKNGLAFTAGKNHDNAMDHRAPGATQTDPRVARVLLFILILFSIARVPATAIHDSPPQTWQAVLAYAAAHHLQWGREILFTYGPLGFLSSEFYWGYFLWPMVVWSFALAMVCSVYLLKLLPRMPVALKAGLLLGLPLVTIPSSVNLNIDPIIYMTTLLGGILCLPDERPKTALLIVTGAAFGFISLIKFTFFLYCGVTLFTLMVTHLLARQLRTILFTLAAFVFSATASCALLHQEPSSMLMYVTRSIDVAVGYSEGMALAANPVDMAFGITVLSLLIIFGALCFARGRSTAANVPRIVIIFAGVFLAWKEGFTRADEHVTVFFVFGFITAAVLPALARGRPTENSSVRAKVPERRSMFRLLLSPRAMVSLNISVMVLAVAPFVSSRKDFGKAIVTGAKSKFLDTLESVVAPQLYSREIILQLNWWKQRAHIGEFRKRIGNHTVDVLHVDQPVAILDDLRYTPHPVFHSYNAYTPTLQGLNFAFFNSPSAPEFLIWRFGTIDSRFPTLDDGSAILAILANYRRVAESGDHALWQRRPEFQSMAIPKAKNYNAIKLGQWFDVPAGAVWFQADLRPSTLGRVQDFLCSGGQLFIEVELHGGVKSRYRLPPGCARSGFLLNPFFRNGKDLGAPAGADKIVRARIFSSSSYCFAPSFNYSLAVIDESFLQTTGADIAKTSAPE